MIVYVKGFRGGVMAPPTKHPSDVILDAAREVILRDGPRAASITAIANASGAPVGTLYHRFGSRDGMLAALWLRALGRFHAMAFAEMRTEDDPVDRGVAIVAATMAFCRSHCDDARLLLAIRRRDLLDADPGTEFQSKLATMNAPVFDELRRLAIQLHGTTNERTLDAITRVIVDLPYSATRRYTGVGHIPDWLDEDVIAAARVLLRAPLDPPP